MLAAALFGASTPLAKRLLEQSEPWLLAGVLYAGSGLGLGLFRLFRSLGTIPAADPPLRRADLPALGAVVLAGGVAAPVLLLQGLASTDAANAALLLNLEGVATMVLAWLVFREHVSARLLLGAAAIVVGSVLLSWTGRGISLQGGSGLVALACVAWAIDNNLTRRLSGADPVQVAMVKGMAAGTVNLLLAWSIDPDRDLPPLTSLVGAIALGAIGYGASLVLFIRALRDLGTARTSAYFSIAPFVGALLALWMFGQAPTMLFGAAALLMAVGVYLHVTESHAHDHRHEPLRHEHAHWHDEHHSHGHSPDVVASEPHSHDHSHVPLSHRHPHYPDLHHRHPH